MKKLLLPVFGLLCVAYYGCDKDDTTTKPTACVNVDVVDSVKLIPVISTYITAQLDSLADQSQRADDSVYLYSKSDSIAKIVINNAVAVNDLTLFRSLGDLEAVYNQPIYFTYCGSASNYKSIYTGDAGHIYADTLNQPNAGTGVSFQGSIYPYAYGLPDTFRVAVVATNVSDIGSQVLQSVDEKSFILK
ncbi:hypothetical protein [Ferruginibacter albus]|uniref:hypothetical protein n=1 Tax=Ferruginibacter albus TaxID=2875540 RepID=UPI001CC600AB|nr:hypothetical protein [Ferruginibacter albus]UAY51529.1 hypothetical protein K9M53_13145 [Ferruginibacter albus]